MNENRAQLTDEILASGKKRKKTWVGFCNCQGGCLKHEGQCYRSRLPFMDYCQRCMTIKK